MAKRIRVTRHNIQKAIRVIGEHRLGDRLAAIDGEEAHQILPQIWPVIRELCVLADACEAGKLQVGS